MLSHCKLSFILLISLAVSAYAAAAQSDMPDSKDHPKIPRVEGTTIVGYKSSGYDEGVFVTGMENRELQTENGEGKRTRIMYLGEKDLSPLGILRNYQKALEDLGQVNEVFSCKGHACYSNLGEIFIWNKNNRIHTSFDKNDNYYLYFSGSHYREQSYWYGTVQSDDALYHVSVYTAVRDSKDTAREGRPLTHLEVIEIADFKPTLKVVKAEEMSAKITEKGHIALYGIHFDSDSDKLKPDSDTAIQEIAKALNAEPSLKLYVVGHTDNEGTLEHNQDLSKRRATSVVRALMSNHSIATDRLTPVGAGLIAPVANNGTEEGRALNRRVELVKR